MADGDSRRPRMNFNVGKSSTQQLCVLSWMDGWDTNQKERFHQTLVEEMASTGANDDVMFGLENMDLSGNSHEMMSCQLRLFRSWFKSWSAEDKKTFVGHLISQDRDAELFLRARNMIQWIVSSCVMSLVVTLWLIFLLLYENEQDILDML